MVSLHHICKYLSMTIVLLTLRQGNLGCKVGIFTYAEPYRYSARQFSHFNFLAAFCSMSALVPHQGEQVSIRVVQFWGSWEAWQEQLQECFSSKPQTTFYCFHSLANSASEDQYQVLLTYHYCWASFEGYQHLTQKSSTGSMSSTLLCLILQRHVMKLPWS